VEDTVRKLLPLLFLIISYGSPLVFFACAILMFTLEYQYFDDYLLIKVASQLWFPSLALWFISIFLGLRAKAHELRDGF
jgi:hypothetical protein